MAEKVNNSILKAEIERLYNTIPVSSTKSQSKLYNINLA